MPLKKRTAMRNQSFAGETAPKRASASTNRVALILSPYFPPSMLAGVHRARHLAKNLPAWGWTPIIVCVDEAHHEERLDPSLAALLPTGIEVVKTGAAPAWLTRRIGVGDIGLRAWAHLRRTVFTIIEKRPVGVVLITGAPFYPMLLASQIKEHFGVPVVLDFQDPWVSAWGAMQPAFSKARLSHRLARLLEPRALRGADYVTSVSNIQNAEMAARHAWFDSSRMAAIPIGGDIDDFKAIGGGAAEAEECTLQPGAFHLSFVGTFPPRSGPLVRVLLQAFAKLRSAEPALAARIRLNFVGTSAQPNDNALYRVRPIAEETGVAEAVYEIPRRLPFLQALKVLTQSSGLLLIGSDEPHYTASRIYPTLMSGRPFLSLFHRASSAHAILSASGGGQALAFETTDELVALEAALVEGLRNLALHPEWFGTVDPAAYALFEARNIARRFADIFDQLATERAA
jgi:glycosyltransferase involved in cell wall biosynthesis